MEDTLISFETAKLAKEKGWDGDFVESHKILTTQSLLQKWLREEHKLSVEVYFNNGWDYDICDLETNLQNISKPYEYKTFENAFEVALMTALNMIKQDFA